jgi:peptidyl-prolyl cis-trans isomerase D
LIDRKVLIATATKEHFSVSDAALRQAIASIPELQVNGQFSAERYNEVLKSIGASSKDFEQGRRAELALDRVLGPIAISARVPKPVLGSIEQALTAERTVRVHSYLASDYQKGIEISDAEVKAWYDQNKAKLELPEQVNAQYLLLNEAAAMQGLPAVSTEEMQKYYEQNKARYVQPARIMLSHILITVPVGATEAQRKTAFDEAQKVAKKVAADKSKFAEIARTDSQDAGTAKDGGRLGWITKGSWPPALEKAVFALKKGEVSGVIDGPGGYHIFEADDVEPEKGESFEQAKSKVESEVRRQLGADRFADMATKLTSLVYDNQGSLQPAADALGLKIKAADGIARDRLLSAAEVGDKAASSSADASILDDARVRRALFSSQVLTDKQNSGVIEISPDTMVVVRVGKIVPAQVPPMEKVSALIRKQLVSERALAAAEKAGQAALADLQKTGAAKVPDDFGAPLTVSRINPQNLTKPLIDAALAAPVKSLPAFEGVKGLHGYTIVHVKQAQAGKTDDPMLATLPAELAKAWGQAEEHAVLQALRGQAKIKMLPEAEKALSGETAQGS